MLLAGGALLGSSTRGGSLFSGDSTNNAANGRAFRPSGALNQPNNQSNSNANGVASSVAPGLVNIVTSLDGGGEGAGTGMIISSNGEVLTNNHVIENADSINVEIGGNGSSHSAKVIGYDVRDDVALIKIDGVSGLDTIPVGNPASASVNDPVLVMGNALGQGGAPAVASGTITAVNQQITATDSDGSNAETLTNLIRVEADVQPGDSGGAIVDNNGQVIGMTTAASTGGFRFREQASGVGFAIRLDKALSIVKQIRNGDETDGVHVGARALLGVSLQDSSNSQFGGRGSSSSTSGALVLDVASNTPAADAGLQQGDVIVSIGDAKVSSTNQLQDVLNTYHPDDKVKVTWTDSSGDTHSATVKLTSGPPA
jgi:S1-C subfamily serine protease